MYRRIYVFIIVILFCSVSCVNMEPYTFVNVKPSIFFKNEEYTVSQKTLSQNELEYKIGYIEKSIKLVSYSEKDNPYKNIGYIYKIKNILVSKSICIEINSKFYIANNKIEQREESDKKN
jgi:hypothetical protein